MITNSKLLFLTIMISFLACKNENELWKVPIGYKNYKISLGDSYEEVSEKIGKLKLDVNSENSDNFNNYLRIPNQVEVENMKVNPIIFLRFNKDELVSFEIVYSIDEALNSIDFQKLIEELGKSELTMIEDLINNKRKSITNNKELWLRRIDVDTISGEHTKITYVTRAIP